MLVAVFGAGVYGGYFGAAQGVLLIGLPRASCSTSTCSGSTRVKNVLAGLVNAVAAVVFIVRHRRRLGRRRR